MKRNFRYAAIAVAAMGLMAACNNNTQEVTLDTMPAIDTTVIEEVVDTVAPDTVVAEPAPAPVKAAKKAVKKQAKKAENTVKTTSLTGKKDVQSVTSELKKAEKGANSVTKSGTNSTPNPLNANKKPASEQTFTKH